MRKIKFEASASVESAFIIPLISFGVIALIILTLFLYNRVKLASDLRYGLEKGREYVETRRSSGESKAKAIIYDQFKKGYLLGTTEGLKVSDEGSEMRGGAALSMTAAALPILDIEGFFNHKKAEDSICTIDREKTLRRIDLGLEIWKGVTGNGN